MMQERSQRGGAAEFDSASWFFDNSLDVLVVLHDRIVERINPAWTALSGWSVEETLGAPFEHFGHPDNMLQIKSAIAQIETYGVAKADVRMRAKDGRWLWLSGRMRLTDDGMLMAVLRDITEEHQRQIEEDQSRHATELLREVAGVRIWRFDPERNLYLVDEHLNRSSILGGFGNRTMKTEEMAAEIHPEDRLKVWDAFHTVMQSGEARIVEYRHADGDGGWRHYKATMRGVRQTPSGKWEVMGLTQDVTELANSRDAALLGEQAAKEAVESKSRFLANMSHEIRTPLNGVLGVLHLLKAETLSIPGRNLLSEALNCGAMLAELLNDVLDFSKIEAGQLELQSEPVDVTAVLEGISALLKSQVEAKGLTLTTTVEPDVGWVRTDPVRLRQVLFNLIGNAVKFTACGGVAITLATTGRGDDRRLRFEVVDTGIGISEEAQGRLFTRFHQADASTTRRFGGTGLGLAISRTLAELMGGEVGVHSVEGQGSTFWFTLPAPPIAAPQEADPVEEGWLDALRVLVVEDNPTNRLIAAKMLENLGAQVEMADNGALGVEAARRADFDLIFMDIQMPVMDGLAATAAIRALSSPQCQTPIIAMTANAMAHQLNEYRQAGMNGAVSKPLSPAAIVAEIAKLLNSEGDAEGVLTADVARSAA